MAARRKGPTCAYDPAAPKMHPTPSLCHPSPRTPCRLCVACGACLALTNWFVCAPAPTSLSNPLDGGSVGQVPTGAHRRPPAPTALSNLVDGRSVGQVRMANVAVISFGVRLGRYIVAVVKGSNAAKTGKVPMPNQLHHARSVAHTSPSALPFIPSRPRGGGAGFAPMTKFGALCVPTHHRCTQASGSGRWTGRPSTATRALPTSRWVSVAPPVWFGGLAFGSRCLGGRGTTPLADTLRWDDAAPRRL